MNTIENIKKNTEDLMRKALEHFDKELIKIRAGKATPTMLEGVFVDYYGTSTPIQQVANITIADSKTLLIQPWEKSTLATIEKAILASNIGVTPQNDGTIVRINLPPLTEERRKDLVKKVLVEAEHTKLSIRNVRRDNMEEVKKMQKNGLGEDEAKSAEKDLQNITDKFIALVDSVVKNKEKEIMTI